MLMRPFSGLLAIPLAALALSGCGDDGGGDVDAAPPDAQPLPDCGCAEPDAAVDAAIDYDLTIESVAGGRLNQLSAGLDIRGAAQLVRMKEALRAELYVEGLSPSVDYIAHVHRLPCDENSAGTHYKHDPALAGESEDNEIWLRFTTDASGIGRATTQQPGKIARMDAQAIVVHDPGTGAKIACADLLFDDDEAAVLEYEGAFAPFPDAPAADASISGTAAMEVVFTGGTSVIRLDLEGLDQTATYAAHVHELPCEVDRAGGHYKIDTTVAGEQEANELWPNARSGDAQVFSHHARYDAQSIVIHRVEASSSVKVACANLLRASEIPEYLTDDSAGALPGAGSQYDDLAATVSLKRKKDGSTEATLDVTGLPAGVTGFGAHVHAGTCELDPPGGPHYKLDLDVAGEVEANEIWLNVDADAQGQAQRTNIKLTHLARPDAMSVVIHEPVTSTRLVCAELF